MIIPAEGGSPAASALHVHEFIDEWISAPYPDQATDRPTVIDGLAWIDAEAGRRFKKDFADLNAAQQTAICGDICYLPKAADRFKTAARFFAKFRDLTAGGFYTTPEGMRTSATRATCRPRPSTGRHPRHSSTSASSDADLPR